MMDKNQPFSLRWFIPEIIRQRVAFIDVAIGALFIHAIALVTPLYFQIVIDKVLVNNAQDTLRTITIGILIAIVFDAILDYLRGFLLLHATSKIDVRVALSFVVLGFSAALAAVIGVLLGPYRRRLEALYAAEGDRQAMLVESIHGIQTVKALSMEPIQRRKWDEKSAQSVAMHFHVGKISITARSISKLLEKAMTVTLVWVGAMLVFDNNLSVGALVAFQMIAGRVPGPLVHLV